MEEAPRDPRKVLRPVKFERRAKHRETSPAGDLAYLRQQNKLTKKTGRSKDLVNAKWRIRYTQIYREDGEE